jgi:hypothetical protein
LSHVSIATIQAQVQASPSSFIISFPKLHPFTIFLFFLALPHILYYNPPPPHTSYCNLQLINQWKAGTTLLEHGLLQASFLLPLL